MIPVAIAPRLALCLVALALLLLNAAPLAADNGIAVSDDQVNEVSKEIFCPVCENVPLDVCPTQACADWRDMVREQLEQGRTKQEIIDYFAYQYGEQVRARPAMSGFSLFIWLMPVLAVVGGAVYFSRYLQRLRDSATGARPVETAAPKKAPPAPDDYRARVEKELEEWK
jgi:cytochrome c-type biogenesis protein CcmH